MLPAPVVAKTVGADFTAAPSAAVSTAAMAAAIANALTTVSAAIAATFWLNVVRPSCSLCLCHHFYHHRLPIGRCLRHHCRHHSCCQYGKEMKVTHVAGLLSSFVITCDYTRVGHQKNSYIEDLLCLSQRLLGGTISAPTTK
jgi:hypothetical protein